MEFINQLLTDLPGLLESFFSDTYLVLFFITIIFITLVYKIGVKVGSKKKPPEFKIKAKESYDLEDFIKK